MAEYILDKVIHYGAFKENLDKIIDIMRSSYAGSVVVRGNSGSGKRTLIKEAAKVTKVKCVYISSDFFTDDYAAMKAIASQLGFRARGAHIADLMREIKSKARGNEKLVIVLSDFEEFCRQRQSLLYNLMNLIHTDPNQLDKGPNLTLIGLTVSLDWAENIEKRVRSRLNAKCIEISFPYRNKEQFVEFASELLGGYKIDDDLKEHLEYIYNFLPNPSTRTLKKYLSKMVDIDKRGNVVLDFDPTNWNTDYQINPNNLLRERLRHLTRSQLDLFKLAVNYCYTNSKPSFTLKELDDHAHRKECKFFLLKSSLTLCDTSVLLKMKLIKPAKHDQPISLDSVFLPGATPNQFKAVISGAAELHSTQTDMLWRTLR
jgi:Cdc6-like AAA superfamily ATPase